VLESEVVTSLSINDVFFAALWCLTMTNSYEDACQKAAKLENTNSYIIEVTGALAGMYYGLESIPKDWISKAKEKYDISAIVF
jgi:ADP-ribosylglycohydrolase